MVSKYANKDRALSEEKMRKIAQALLFLAIAKDAMEKQVQNRAPPSLLLLTAYIRTYAWLVGQIIELSKSHSCDTHEQTS
jgi:hypothetical protein